MLFKEYERHCNCRDPSVVYSMQAGAESEDPGLFGEQFADYELGALAVLACGAQVGPDVDEGLGAGPAQGRPAVHGPEWAARYSVPASLVGFRVELDRTGGRIRAADTETGEVVANHPAVAPGEASRRVLMTPHTQGHRVGPRARPAPTHFPAHERPTHGSALGAIAESGAGRTNVQCALRTLTRSLRSNTTPRHCIHM